MLVAATGMVRRSVRRAAGGPPSSAGGAIRNLNLHEFPSMELVRDHGIRTPMAFLASDPEEAREIFRRNFITGKPILVWEGDYRVVPRCFVVSE